MRAKQTKGNAPQKLRTGTKVRDQVESKADVKVAESSFDAGKQYALRQIEHQDSEAAILRDLFFKRDFIIESFRKGADSVYEDYIASLTLKDTSKADIGTKKAAQVYRVRRSEMRSVCSAALILNDQARINPNAEYRATWEELLNQGTYHDLIRVSNNVRAMKQYGTVNAEEVRAKIAKHQETKRADKGSKRVKEAVSIIKSVDKLDVLELIEKAITARRAAIHKANAAHAQGSVDEHNKSTLKARKSATRAALKRERKAKVIRVMQAKRLAA